MTKAILRNNKLYCGKCFSPASIFAPELVQTGRGRPKDMCCPACGRKYDSITRKEYKGAIR